MIPVLGVDPGTKGGLVLLRGNGSLAGVWTLSPDMTEVDAVENVRLAAESLKAYRGVCYFEKVGFKRGDGGKGAFTFGGVTKLVAGALIALDVRPRYVAPMMWQSALGCLTGGNKNVTTNLARQLWPGEKWTQVNSDAALIAEYGRRRMTL